MASPLKPLRQAAGLFSCAHDALLAMKPLIFSIHSDGPDRMGLALLAEHYVNQLRIPTHLTPDQARDSCSTTSRGPRWRTM